MPLKDRISENAKDMNGMRHESQGSALRSYTVTDRWTQLTRVFTTKII